MSDAFKERFKTKSSTMSKSGNIDIDLMYAVSKSAMKPPTDFSPDSGSNFKLFPPILNPTLHSSIEDINKNLVHNLSPSKNPKTNSPL